MTTNPNWMDTLYQRCINWANSPRFPEQDLAERFSSNDSEDRLPPAQELARFVFQRCRERTNEKGRMVPNPAATGAERLIQGAISSFRDVLSQWDFALLTSAHALLLRQAALETGGGPAASSKALRAFMDALETFDALQVSVRLKRHLSWLAAETIITSSPNTTDRTRAANLIIAACSGPPDTATPGLYFSCLSRLFWLIESPGLPLEARSQVIEKLRPFLYRAWTVVSPAELRADASAKPHHAIEQKSEDDQNRATRLGDLEFGSHVNDRFAICAALARFETDADSKNVFGFEAVALLQKIDETWVTRAPVLTKPIVTFVEKLKFEERPQLPSFSYNEVGGFGSGELFESSDTDAISKTIEERIAASSDDCEKLIYRLKGAELFGNRVSALREREEIQSVLSDISSYAGRQYALVRTHAFRLLAKSLWAMYDDEAALMALGHAQTAAGEAASPEDAIWLMSLDRNIRKSLGNEVSKQSYNARIFWLAELWNRVAWNRFSVGQERLFDQFKIDAVTDAGLLKRAIDHLRVDDYSNDELRRISQVAVATKWSYDPVSWALALDNLHNRLQKRGPGILYNALQRNCVIELARIAQHTLRNVRAAELIPRIARILAGYLIYHREQSDRDPPRDFKTLVVRTLIAAGQQERDRVYRLKKLEHRPAVRRRIRSLLGSLAECDALRDAGEQLTELLDACKPIDDIAVGTVKTETAAAMPPSGDGALEGSDPLETDALMLMDVSEIATTTRSSKKPPADGDVPILSFYLAQAGQKKIDRSFAVLRTDANEKSFYLPGATKTTKEFCNATVSFARVLPGGDGSKPSLSNAFNRIRNYLETRRSNTDFEERYAQMQQRFLTTAQDLGIALFPPSLLTELGAFRQILLVPDRELFALPLHLLTLKDGSRLIEKCAVSYVPKSDYGDSEDKLGEDSIFALLNADDPALSSIVERLTAELRVDNMWESSRNPNGVVKKCSRANTAIFFTHGTAARGFPLSNRITLTGGGRLTQLDILNSDSSFTNTNVLLMACHTADQTIEETRQVLGLSSAFLRRGVRSITACLWEAKADDAASLCIGMLQCKDESCSSKAFQRTLLSMIAPLSKTAAMVQTGCFVRYGR
jgi:hypothetical protein